jgi:predicted LPLAT superfamily acyltransferase
MQHQIDSGVDQPASPEWVARPERSNTLAIRLIVWIALTLGRPVARLLLYPICLYFLIFSSAARAASGSYLRRALGRKPEFADLFRHYLTFASTILDRVFLLSDRYDRFDVRVHGAEIVDEMVARGEGGFLLGAHMGSFEIVRAVGRETRGLRIRLVMYEENARKINSVLTAINPNLSLEIIALGKLESMLKVEAALKCGEFVGMLGDRTIEGEGTRHCDFLGGQVKFPAGPFRVAAMLKRPIVLMFGLYRGANRYDVYFERLAAEPNAGDPDRNAWIEQSMRRYAERLEYYCRLAPYNWFNFYDIWR